VRFRATPPAFRLIRKILQSGSLVKVSMALPFSVNVHGPIQLDTLDAGLQIILNYFQLLMEKTARVCKLSILTFSKEN